MYRKRDNKSRIMGLYVVDYRGQFYVREIARLLRIPLKNVQMALNLLEQEKIVKSRVSGKNKYFQLNLDNIQTKFMLIKTEIDRTMEFIEKKKGMNLFLKELKTDATCIIFGSYAREMEQKNSDIDLLTVTEKKEELPFHLLPLKVHQITISEKTFKAALQARETLIKEIEKNHILLNNHSWYVREMWHNYEK